MPGTLLRVLHWFGLTNLTDAQVRQYRALRRAGARKVRITFTSAPILSGRAKPDIRSGGSVLAVTGAGR
jgi:hypothetical protein